MSELGAASGNGRDEDCPLCLEPLPPFWEDHRIVKFRCCGQQVCMDCRDDRQAFLDNAADSGTWGREEEQLQNCCPFCRSKSVDCMSALVEKYELDQLPLDKYMDVGRCYLNGRMGVEQNVEKGIEIWKLGAEMGDPNCQYQIGLGHYIGEDGLEMETGAFGMPKSPEEAKRWFLAAAEQGHALAEFGLAEMADKEGNESDYLRYLRNSASKGYDGACYNLGLAYYYGKEGLKQSNSKAIDVVTQAAEKGHAGCMWVLGSALCDGEDGEEWLLPQDNPNFTVGVHWIRRAAKAGHQKAMTSLGELEKEWASCCFLCGKEASPEKSFLRCSRCRAAWYCSKKCQVQHWKAEEGGHKQFCIKWCPQK